MNLAGLYKLHKKEEYDRYTFIDIEGKTRMFGNILPTIYTKTTPISFKKRSFKKSQLSSKKKSLRL